MTSTPIRTITGLIARLEEVRADLDPRHLTTLRQYEHVGWALRPLDTLIDRCREEALAIRRDQHLTSITRLRPNPLRAMAAAPAPLPAPAPLSSSPLPEAAP
jgi:hypothetical protein